MSAFSRRRSSGCANLFGEIDMLLVMTIEPGFGAQPFLEVVLLKLRRARGRLVVGGRVPASIRKSISG